MTASDELRASIEGGTETTPQTEYVKGWRDAILLTPCRANYSDEYKQGYADSKMAIQSWLNDFLTRDSGQTQMVTPSEVMNLLILTAE